MNAGVDRRETFDTIAAVATPAGLGALAVLRLSGPQALKSARSFLRPHNGEESFAPRVATLASAKEIDQVVVIYFRAPQSPTGEDVVEISSHGSPYIIKRLLEEALASGARMAQPGEFTQRAYLNGKMDLAQAEAVASLIEAGSERAHRAALAQLEGGLSREIKRLRARLLDFLVQVEANLDHPEEDIPSFEGPRAEKILADVRQEVRALAGTFSEGRLLSEGARLCIAGRPNAGKSSLLNALLGVERAIVCPTPGTTRDTIEEPFQIAGSPAILIDTAGIRESQAIDEAESLGIARSGKALETCDLAILVVDGSKALDEDDASVHRRIIDEVSRSRRPLLTVLSKSDLPRLNPFQADVSASTFSRGSINELKKMIADRLMSGRAAMPAALVTSLRHHKALLNSADELDHCCRLIASTGKDWEDRVACHLRESLRLLGEIIGEGTADEVLAQIFSRFCVGK